MVWTNLWLFMIFVVLYNIADNIKKNGRNN
jgi:hypothetical protein